MIVIGIDPGASGALCALDTSTGDTGFHPTPNEKKLVTPTAVLDWLNDIHTNHGPIRVIGIEKVNAISLTAAGSTFAFGYNYGMITCIASLTGIGIELVTPREWQRAIKAPTKKKAGGATALKRAIASIAMRLYPKADLYGPRGGLKDGYSDALMIAHVISQRY